jgi:hypothetical protein
MPPVTLPTTVPAEASVLAEITAARRHRWRKLVVHYLEMVVAMALGMVALHPLWELAFGALGWGAVLDRPEPMALVMATNMTVFMAAWMKFRRHTWRPIAEMSAAMYLPFLALFVPMWAGLISPSGMLLWGHVLMLFAMAGAMAIRPHEYTHC